LVTGASIRVRILKDELDLARPGASKVVTGASIRVRILKARACGIGVELSVAGYRWSEPLRPVNLSDEGDPVA